MQALVQRVSSAEISIEDLLHAIDRLLIFQQKKRVELKLAIKTTYPSKSELQAPCAASLFIKARCDNAAWALGIFSILPNHDFKAAC